MLKLKDLTIGGLYISNVLGDQSDVWLFCGRAEAKNSIYAKSRVDGYVYLYMGRYKEVGNITDPMEILRRAKVYANFQVNSTIDVLSGAKRLTDAVFHHLWVGTESLYNVLIACNITPKWGEGSPNGTDRLKVSQLKRGALYLESLNDPYSAVWMYLGLVAAQRTPDSPVVSGHLWVNVCWRYECGTGKLTDSVLAYRVDFALDFRLTCTRTITSGPKAVHPFEYPNSPSVSVAELDRLMAKHGITVIPSNPKRTRKAKTTG